MPIEQARGYIFVKTKSNPNRTVDGIHVQPKIMYSLVLQNQILMNIISNVMCIVLGQQVITKTATKRKGVILTF